MLRGLIAFALAASLWSVLSVSAGAQTSPWWPGDPEVILGYGCTAITLEPHDSRFQCPSWASHVHEAIDIDLANGTPIHAGWPGTVIEVGGAEAHDYGPHYVKIWLDQGDDILLGHLSDAAVALGQRVEVGTLLGYVGDLGETDIPNLDFSARPHGAGPYSSIDPSPFLSFLDRAEVSPSYAGRDLLGRIQVLGWSKVDGSIWSTDLAGASRAVTGGPRGGFAAEPIVASDGRGQLVAFAVGLDGALWTSAQLNSAGPTTRWRAWLPLGRPAAALVGTPAAALDPDGGLHVFVRAADGTLWESHQDRAGGHWSGWSGPAFGHEVAGDPAAARDSGGTLEVFATSRDGAIVVNRQAQAGGAWTGWYSLAAPAIGIRFTGRPAMLRDAAGLLELFGTTVDGSVFGSTQVTGGSYGQWSGIGWGDVSAVAAALKADGRVQVFALSRSGLVLETIRQGGAWTRWTALGQNSSGGLAVTLAADGSPIVLTGSVADTFVVRPGDPQWFDRHSRGAAEIKLATTQAQAWTALPRARHTTRPRYVWSIL